ncbi:D-amino-acid transaminase [Bacillus sp. 1P06AnD]|uniref:D-amino-acid transaminase n=1 Tax=Bacillus sp. 1P06AnD TaxID=3132208 RepID=UPI00399F1978
MGKSVIFKGKMMLEDQAHVDIEDRGYQFGDGVYEMIRVYNGKMFSAEEHLQRLVSSTEKIHIDLVYSINEMHDMLQELIVKNQLLLGTVYVQVTRGTAPRSHAFPGKNVSPVFTAYTKEVERPLATMGNGVKALTVEDIRWLMCDVKSLNLLGNVLAKQKAVEQGCYEAIQHRAQEVTEGSSSNIYIVQSGKIITHPANNLILNGIVRQVILCLAKKNGLIVEERPFSLSEIVDADEVFLTSTTSEITPIVEVDGRVIADGKPGKMTKQIQRLYLEEIIHQCGLID